MNKDIKFIKNYVSEFNQIIYQNLKKLKNLIKKLLNKLKKKKKFF